MKYLRRAYRRGQLVHQSINVLSDDEATQILADYNVSTRKELIDRWNSVFKLYGRNHQHSTWFYNLIS